MSVLLNDPLVLQATNNPRKVGDQRRTASMRVGSQSTLILDLLRRNGKRVLGNVIVARKDRSALTTDELAGILDYYSGVLDAFGENGPSEAKMYIQFTRLQGRAGG